MNKKMLPPTPITDKQRDWMEKEKEKTGETFATIIRKLIEDRMRRGKK